MSNSLNHSPACQMPLCTALFTWFCPVFPQVVCLTQNNTRGHDLSITGEAPRPAGPRWLPEELWRRIFSFAAYADPVMTRPSVRATVSFKTSIRISQVCRLWRNIALDCPEMWGQGFHVYMTTQQILEILLRVPGRTIQFVVPRGRRDEENGRVCWLSARDGLENTRHPYLLWNVYDKSNALDAVVSMADAKFLVWSRIKRRLPMLDSISLTLANISDPEVPWSGPGLRLRDQALYQSSDESMRGQPWRLRTLELMGCFFPLDGFYLRNLQEVWIASAITAEYEPSINLMPITWLTTLSGMQQLRSLALMNSIAGSSIDECVEEDESDLSEEWQLISFQRQQWFFPSLQELVVASGIKNNHQLKSSCQEFLWHMRVPENCVVNTFFDNRWEATGGGM